MTKFQWTKKQVDEATRDHPPANPVFIEAFLREVQAAGEGMTRVQFFEIYRRCAPTRDENADYFDYEILSDHFTHMAGFHEAWKLVKTKPLPKITTAANASDVGLPLDFISLGGKPEWIQGEEFPICPKCDKDMVLLLQLKSLPYEITKLHRNLRCYTFGDAGNFYVFTCPKCGTFKTSSECY